MGEAHGYHTFRDLTFIPLAECSEECEIHQYERDDAATAPVVTLTRAVQTCGACPSQWDAWDADSDRYYLRYRHGHGSIERSVLDGWKVVAEFDWTDPDTGADGVISLAEFARQAGIKLAEGVS